MENRKQEPRRMSDAVINDRLNKLEEIYADLKEIREWMASVTRVFRLFEMLGCFMSKWAVRLGKIAAATAAIWLCLKGCAHDVRALFLR